MVRPKIFSGSISNNSLGTFESTIIGILLTLSPLLARNIDRGVFDDLETPIIAMSQNAKPPKSCPSSKFNAKSRASILFWWREYSRSNLLSTLFPKIPAIWFIEQSKSPICFILLLAKNFLT